MKRIAILVGLAALVALLLVLKRSAPQQEIAQAPAYSNTAPVLATNGTGAAVSIAAPRTNSSGTTSVVHTSQEAAADLMRRFASVAGLYDFNPVITNYSRRFPGRGRVEVVGATTPTHVAQIYNGHLLKIQSQVGRSDTRRDPSVEKDWYAGLVKWTDEEAIVETLRILQAIGATETLAAVRDGRKEVTPFENTIRHPDGTRTVTTVFKTVALQNKDGNTLLRAEYRMGPTGNAGLTSWFHLGR